MTNSTPIRETQKSRRAEGGMKEGSEAVNAESFEKVLRAMINRRPFKPFTVEFKTGQRVEVDAPDATLMRQHVAIYIAPGFVPIYFDSDSVIQIIDSPAHAAPGRGE